MNVIKRNTRNQHYTQILHDTVNTSSPLSIVWMVDKSVEWLTKLYW